MKFKGFGPVVEHAGSGFKMPEAIARTIETLAKGLPKECTYRRSAKRAGKSPEIDAANREETSYITTDAKDRAGEVVLPSGLIVKDYSGVVTWCHSYGPTEGWIGLPVGRAMWLKAWQGGEKNGIVSRTKYTTKPDGYTEWLPDAIVHYQKQNPPELVDKSIGFIPLSIREAEKSEKSLHPEWDGCPIIDKWAILEYAVVPVPCNPEANQDGAKAFENAAAVIKGWKGEEGESEETDGGAGEKEVEPAKKEPPIVITSPAAEPVKIVPFVKASTINQAVARSLEMRKDELAKSIGNLLVDEFCRRTGRP